MKIIDAHTHIDYITPDLQVGVIACVCCAVTEGDWSKIIDLMKCDKRVYGAFGIHPWYVDSVAPDVEVALEKLLKSDSNYMVGEIGLDKYKPNMEKQMDVFVKQFDVAVKLKRTVFLHCVGAWDKILYVLKQYKNLPIIIAHDFNGNNDIVEKLLRYENIYFFFGKNALYDINSRIEQIPLNRILVESDGKPDVDLTEIINKISLIKNESNVADVIYNNTQRILKNG